MSLTCGIDWAEGHHDAAIVDEAGRVAAERRIRVDAAGFAELLGLLAEFGDGSEAPIPVAIETASVLLVSALVASGRRVYVINPLAVSRYRDRHRASRAKSDARDAIVLANILRTDAHAYRALPAESTEVQALRVLTRAQQDALWDRVGLTNRLRGLLRRYFPAAVAAFEGVASTASIAGRAGRSCARHPRRPVPRSSRSPAWRRCCGGLGGRAASPPRRTACKPSCELYDPAKAFPASPVSAAT
jgi:transposase